MLTQEQLSELFVHAEKHRLKGVDTVGKWGSKRQGDKDTLWNVETKEQWVRDHPEGEWRLVQDLGSGSFARVPAGRVGIREALARLAAKD